MKLFLFHTLHRMGGVVLNIATRKFKFKGYVVFQPIINGICGNLLSIYSSHMSTDLHKKYEIGSSEPDYKFCQPPWRTLCMPSKGEF